MIAEFRLEWPPAVLGPNRTRGLHWSRLHKALKSYRDACFIAMLEQGCRQIPIGELEMTMLFVPPMRGAFDLDNLLARMKSGIDGVARAWSIDDKLFVAVSGRMGERSEDPHVRCWVDVVDGSRQ
jgi:crossover junction endodeoxyribonuclease RusA